MKSIVEVEVEEVVTTITPVKSCKTYLPTESCCLANGNITTRRSKSGSIETKDLSSGELKILNIYARADEFDVGLTSYKFEGC